MRHGRAVLALLQWISKGEGEVWYLIFEQWRREYKQLLKSFKERGWYKQSAGASPSLILPDLKYWGCDKQSVPSISRGCFSPFLLV
jgi:hypothetical protein